MAENPLLRRGRPSPQGQEEPISPRQRRLQRDVAGEVNPLLRGRRKRDAVQPSIRGEVAQPRARQVQPEPKEGFLSTLFKEIVRPIPTGLAFLGQQAGIVPRGEVSIPVIGDITPPKTAAGLAGLGLDVGLTAATFFPLTSPFAVSARAGRIGFKTLKTSVQIAKAAEKAQVVARAAGKARAAAKAAGVTRKVARPVGRTFAEKVANKGLNTIEKLNPSPVIRKALKDEKLVTEVLLSSGFGAGFGLAKSLQDEDNPNQNSLDAMLKGAAFGAALPPLLRGAGKLIAAPFRIFETKLGKKFADTYFDSQLYKIYLGGSRKVLSKMGVHGQKASRLILTARNQTEQLAANDISQMLKVLKPLSTKDKRLFEKVAQREPVTEIIPDKVQKAVDQWVAIRGSLAQEAERIGMKKIGLDGLEYDWTPRQNFLPHLVDPRKLFAKGVVKGQKEPVKKASLESAKEHMVRTGQARNLVDAESKLHKFVLKNRERRAGSLEHARGQGLPEEFYLKDPSEYIPKYILDSRRRLTEASLYGKKDEVLEDLISKIASDPGVRDGDGDIARRIFNRILGKEERDLVEPVSRFLRQLETFSLGLAQISNATQTINTATMAGVRNTSKGLRAFFTKEGTEFAEKSGATLDSALQDMMEEVMRRTFQEKLKKKGVSKFSQKAFDEFKRDIRTEDIMRAFFRFTGFTGTERFNRAVAANTAKFYVMEWQAKFLNNPNNRAAALRLKEMGFRTDLASRGRPNNILFNPILSLDDPRLLRAGKIMAEKTQFRTAPQDLPLFFSSSMGRLLTQFKNFAFKQSEFMTEQVLREASRGNFVPLIRFSLIAVFLGEASADIKAIARGNTKRFEKKGVERMIDNISSVGGFGIMQDAIRSAQTGSLGTRSFLLGPALTDIADITGAAGKALSGEGTKELQKVLSRKIPVIGPKISAEIRKRK